MKQKFDSSSAGVDKNAFRRLPNQPLTDPPTAKANREARKISENVYKPDVLLGQSAPIEGAPSISELARALKNDVDLIYQYVHDTILFSPQYGLHKGGWGALVEGYGNPFDQSDLMVQLLTAAGYTASYVVGYILLDASQWSNWLNVSTSDITNAARLLGNGGFNGSYDTETNTITLDYCWVQCEIDGTNYQFDPAMKTYDYVTGINLASAMGYNQSTFLSDAQSSATVTSNYAQNINEPNISADLTTYATNLVEWIASNNSGATFEEILGGQTIVPTLFPPSHNTSLPYQDGTPTVLSSLTSAYKATLQIQYGSINETFFTNDIYGYRMSMFWNTSNEAQLYLNLPGTSGNIVATSGVQTIGDTYPMTFTVTHPYATSFADQSSTITLTAGAYYAIGTAWGYAGRQMAEVHRQSLVQAMNAGGSTVAENVLGESLSTIWWNFSGENTSGTEIINGLSNCINTFHHNIGVIAFFPDPPFTTGGNAITVNFFFNVWSTSALTTAANVDASSAHVSLLWHMLEAAVVTQTPGVACTSAPSVINSANGGSATATITGTVHVGDVLNIFVHDSRLSTNPTQVSYTTVSGDTTTTIATNLAVAINNTPTVAAIGVTATSAANVVRIGSFSYNNTTFTESVTVGSELIALVASPGTIIYGASKTNWLSVVKPALTTAGYTTAEIGIIASFVSNFGVATVTGTVASGGGDVLNIFVYDAGLAINPTEISYTTISGDTTTSIATNLATAINAKSTLAMNGITATSSANVLTIASQSPNATTFTQSVTVGSESISLPNVAYAAIGGTVEPGSIIDIYVYNAGLTTNPTEISYIVGSNDTLVTIAANLASAINGTSSLGAIDVTAASSANVLQLQSLSVHSTTYTGSTPDGYETITFSYGGTVTIPDQPYVYVGDYFIGYGYYALTSLGSEFFGPLNNTGKGADSGDISDSECNDGCSGSSIDVNGNGAASFALEVSNEPIDLFKGRYLYSNADITVGSQAEPYSLSLVRSFNSGNGVNNDGLGYGWNHNHQISAAVNSDGFIAFGYQSVSAAAAAIAEMYVCQDLLQATTPAVPIQNAVTICIANQWLMNQIANNTAVVQFGSEYQVFAKLPNGSYVAPLGIKTATELAYSTTFTYTTPDKVVYAFNSSGKISTITYPFGVTITYTYTSGLLTQVSNGMGRTLYFNYSTGGSLNSVTDGNGRTVSYTINSSNELTAFTDALSNSTTYSYYSSTTGQLHQIFRPANPTNAVVTNQYDTLGRINQQTDAYGNVWNYYFAGSRTEEDDPNGNSHVLYFDSFGSTVMDIDALGNTTTSEFDGLERVTLVTLPEGNSNAFVYDANSNILQITAQPKPGSSLSNITNVFTIDPNWNKVHTAQDGNGNITTYNYSATTSLLSSVVYPTVSAGTPAVSYNWNSRGQVLSVTDPTSIVTSFSYDSATEKLLSLVVDSGTGRLNLTTNFGYDAPGNITSVQDANGNTTYFAFDFNRRLTARTEAAPFGYVTLYFYDQNGNLVILQSQTGSSPAWQTYSATYAIDGLASVILDPSQHATQYFYDNMRRLQQTVDADGDIYKYFYDQLSRLYQLVDPTNAPTETRTYTDNGYLASVEDALTQLTQYSYDDFDRSSQIVYADSTSEQNSLYDANGNVLTFVNRSTNTITFTFDALNRVLTKSPQSQATVSFGYDLAGRLLTTSTPVVSGNPATGTFTWVYDTAGRFYQEEYPDGLTVTHQLDANGNVIKTTYPDTYYIQKTVDQLNRLTEIFLNGSSSPALQFSYDALSRRTALTYGNAVVASTGFDPSDNLLSLVFAIQSPASYLQFGYGYNNVNQENYREANSLSLLWQPPTVTVDYTNLPNGVNQYHTVDTVGGPSYSYVYNGNGCVTSDGVNTYSYDTENHLLSAVTGSATVDFAYDPFHRQIQKIIGSTSTQFFYSGLQRIADYNGSGTLLNRYVYGNGIDEPLIAISSAGTITYLHADETGSIIASTNSSGALLSQSTYSPWGESTSVNGFNFGFTGQRLDPETGLYYFKARYYSPTTGRFLQNDPIGYDGGDLSLYGYAGNDPLNLFDPFGLAAEGGGSGSGAPPSAYLRGSISQIDWSISGPFSVFGPGLAYLAQPAGAVTNDAIAAGIGGALGEAFGPAIVKLGGALADFYLPSFFFRGIRGQTGAINLVAIRNGRSYEALVRRTLGIQATNISIRLPGTVRATPDHLSPHALLEIKNVAQFRNTPQFRANAEFARQYNIPLRYIIHPRAANSISPGVLRRFMELPGSQIYTLDPITRALTLIN